MSPVLGYWKIRGLAQPIRLLLTYTGTEFEDKLYECGPAPEFDRSSWFEEKQKLGLDFPNLPYYIDGDVKITQSNAIMRAIARKHNLEGITEEERARVDQTLYQVVDYKLKFITLCYGANFDKLRGSYLEDLPADLTLLSAYLGKHKYFAGENVTFPDFVAYEYLVAITALKPDVLDNFANLKDFKSKIEKLPSVAKFINSSEAAKYPLNNKSASFGGQ